MPEQTAVFLCDCGNSLGNIDFEMLAGELGAGGTACHVVRSTGLCLEEGLRQMRSVIQDKGIDRVVVAACSPSARQLGFQEALEQAGLNPGLFAMANIREQCSWVDGEDATRRALELVRMAAGKVRTSAQRKTGEAEVSPDVLVVGGGFCGMRSALEISRLGLKVTLVEREPRLGGRDAYYVSSLGEGAMAALAQSVAQDDHIATLTGAWVAKAKGDVGRFLVTIATKGARFERRYGAILLATGHGTQALPDALGQTPGILSEEAFAQILRHPEKLSKRPQAVAFAVGPPGRDSRRAALSALSGALAAKDKLGCEVYVFLRQVEVDSDGAEALYREARERGVVFLKTEEPPRIASSNGRLKAEVKDLLLGREVSVGCDLLITEGGALPSEGAQALGLELRAGTDPQGFLQDENVHLYPVSSRKKGVFFVGSCRGDLDLARTELDIANVALRVHQLLSRGKVAVDVEKVKAQPDKCRTCLTCIRACPHNAIELVRTEEEGEIAQISDPACDGCGICMALCPAKAIAFTGSSDEELLAQVDAMERGRIVAFCCAESAYRAADRAGRLRMPYPPETRVIQVPCVGRVDLLHILRAFEGGAAGVLLMGCPEGSCRHMEGSTRAKQRAEYAQSLLGELGMDGAKVRFVGLGPDMAWRFTQELFSMSKHAQESEP